MIQRLLYKALQAGLSEIQDNPDTLDDIFVGNYELEIEEAAAIRTFFKEKPPKVIHGYARSDQTFPLYSIVLASEREADAIIGDDAGIVSDPELEDFGSNQYSAFWEHTYNLMCYAEHPDACLYIYEVAKAIMQEAKPTFIPYGIYDMNLSGSDLIPDPRYIPENIFVRQLTFTCRAEFLTVAQTTRFGKAFKVAGIHVDKNGSPSDVGNVKTLVTVKALGEE